MIVTTDDTIEITRPEGLSDAVWAQAKVELHRIMTGHAPWCSDHESEDSDYCRHEVRGFAGDVIMENSRSDGSTTISLFPAEGVDIEAMNISQAACIAESLAEAAKRARLGNLTKD